MTTVIDCAACGRQSLRDAGPCPACGSTKVTPRPAADSGVLVSWTVIRRPPKNSTETGPYTVAVVRLGDGPTVCGRIKNAEFAGPVGVALSLCTIENGVPVFEPAEAAR
jgi:uncharacterized OB-fold protein